MKVVADNRYDQQYAIAARGPWSAFGFRNGSKYGIATVWVALLVIAILALGAYYLTFSTVASDASEPFRVRVFDLIVVCMVTSFVLSTILWFRLRIAILIIIGIPSAIVAMFWIIHVVFQV